ncbi:DUF7557 family protein [Methanogenium cariaci]|jgi:predicted transcriptional regulator
MPRASNPEQNPDPESATIPIRISPRTREQLDFLKDRPDESYDAVIARLTDRVIDEPLSEETLKAIEKSLTDLRKGISDTHEEIVQEILKQKEG